MPNPSATALCFKVAEALARNVGRAVARPDPDDMRALGLAIGDFVAVWKMTRDSGHLTMKLWLLLKPFSKESGRE